MILFLWLKVMAKNVIQMGNKNMSSKSYFAENRIFLTPGPFSRAF